MTVASCAYSSQFQLIWLRRTLGKRKNGPRAQRLMRSAIRSSVSCGSRSASRARHAYMSASATFGSIDLSIAESRVPRLSTQPGLWNCGSPSGEASRSLHGGDWHRRRASARARLSLRDAPS